MILLEIVWVNESGYKRKQSSRWKEYRLGNGINSFTLAQKCCSDPNHYNIPSSETTLTLAFSLLTSPLSNDILPR